MKKKSPFIIYLAIITILIFCISTLSLFLYIKDLNKLYEDRMRISNKAYINYPYFADSKDLYIEDYLNTIDFEKIDKVKYIVNYLGDYINILFKLYKNDIIVDYNSLVFNKENIDVNINELITNEEVLEKEIIDFIAKNKEKITSEELNYATKSYLFKDKDIDIYLTNYDSLNSITLVTINYIKIKDYLNFPYTLDKNYQEIPEVTTKSNIITTSPINNESRKQVAFTFDDGPSNYTLDLLDLLDKYQAKATFFMVGYNIKVRNSTVLEMYNRGFELGNHTVDHSRLTKLSCDKVTEKITVNNDLVLNITDNYMRLFRPPYGSVNNKIAGCINMPVIMWSIDSRDWESRNTEKIVAEVLSNIGEGDIVLFHDLYPTTLEAVEILLPVLYSDNYEVVTVSELFSNRDTSLENGLSYRKAS